LEQDPRGGLIQRWSFIPAEEELVILQQFLRFPVTRPISLALIRENFPVNNNNTLSSSPPSSSSPYSELNINSNNIYSNIINNNNNSSPKSNGSSKYSPTTSISPTSTSPKQSSEKHSNSSLGIHRKSPSLHFHPSGLSNASLPVGTASAAASSSPNQGESIIFLRNSFSSCVMSFMCVRCVLRVKWKINGSHEIILFDG